jgi:hypothetical protein
MAYIKGSDMFLVYEDSEGTRHFQHWLDLPEVGGLIDEDGEDMELIGWAQSREAK